MMREGEYGSEEVKMSKVGKKIFLFFENEICEKVDFLQREKVGEIRRF